MSNTLEHHTHNRGSRNVVRSQIPVLGPYKRSKLWLLHRARGVELMVDAAPIREHLEWLQSIGFNYESIGIVAGIPPQTLWLAKTDGHKRMHIERAARLMAVTHVPVPAQANTKVPAIGTRRRLQALQAIGYTYASLSVEFGGVTPEAIRQYTTGTVRGATWMRVRDVYERLSGTPGPSKVAIARARRRGYAPPIAWEGVDIDHPDSKPLLDADLDLKGTVDEVLLQRMIDGRHTGEVRGAERKALIDHAIEHGWDHERLARSLNISPDGAGQALVRRRRELREAA